jgi:hypothetical protein
MELAGAYVIKASRHPHFRPVGVGHYRPPGSGSVIGHARFGDELAWYSPSS